MPEIGSAGKTASRGIGLTAAVAIVVGNMVGTGAFTSLGFQLEGVSSTSAILLLWALGGGVALCGALSYAELASVYPRSGGEYHFLGRIFHPMAGFMAGWVSVTVGFAAPVALSAMAFGGYASAAWEGFAGGFGDRATIVPEDGGMALRLAFGVVLFATALHGLSVRLGSAFQIAATSLKVVLLAALTAAGLLWGSQPLRVLPQWEDAGQLWSVPFAVSLVYVMYAYAGWNAACYVAGEFRDARKTVVRGLVIGTVLVTLLYVLLHAAMLRSAPREALRGELEVAAVAAGHVLGAAGGTVLAALIGLGLVSSISAMTWAGPRVAQTMGEDYPPLRFLARKTRGGAPWAALLLQTAITLLLLMSSTFERVLVYTEFVILLSSAATVLGVFVSRRRHPQLERPYRLWGYPFTPAVFLAVSGYMLVFLAVNRPQESFTGLLTLAGGALLYVITRVRK
ncbi:MAG TPA: amino acid permease [Verrucomicrobiales bacterium]|nr:amino acid permease [Verrucomicrobiales bacterium]